MIKRRKAISQVLAFTMMLSTLTINANALEPRAAVSGSTISGTDRYETAVKVSENGWTSATNAVLINGSKGLVDALTATPYASLKNAPILITEKDKLTATTKARLTKLGVKNVDIVGGEGVVSLVVENELKNMGLTVKRIKGDDRYQTAVAVANEIKKLTTVTKIAVVNGATGLPDAVSISAPAADNNMPILLSDPKNGITEANKFISTVNVSKSYVLGQVGSVSDSVMNSLPGVKTRLGGNTRHDTNSKIMETFYTNKELDNIYVAKSGYVKNNEELVDALAVGVLAAKNNDPLLIVGKSLEASQTALLKQKSFTKITLVGDGVPAATIQAIKDTQKDPEAKVSNVSLVDYKTIKITGTELNRIDKTSITMSGNTVATYAPNTAGTEATVTFVNAFTDGTNTVTVKSNLATSTNHTFTYAAAITSVQGSTSEIGTSGIQYLELTVNNGQKRTLEELKALGYTVEFKSTQKIFYLGAGDSSTTSTNGKLRTNITAPATTPFEKDDTFTYEIELKKDNKIIKSPLKAVKVVDKTDEYKQVTSFNIALNGGVKLNSNKMVVNESADIEEIKLINNNNANVDLTTATESSTVTVTSSNPAVLKVDNTGVTKNKLTALSNGTADITVTAGSVSKKVTVTVVSQAREFSKVELASSTANVVAGSTISINAIVKDQYGDPVLSHKLVPEKTDVYNGSETTNPIATVESISTTDATGKATINLTATSKVGNGNLIFKKGTSTLATLRVNVIAIAAANTWKLETSAADTNLDIYTPVEKTADTSLDLNLNGYINSTYLVGNETQITKHTTGTIPTTGIFVTTSDATIADIDTITTGNIKIIAKTKVGTATIKAYKDGKEVAYKTIAVANSTPKLTAIKTNTIDTIKTTGVYDVVKNILDLTEVSTSKFVAGGLTINGTAEEVILGTNGTEPVLYVDYNKDGKYTKNTTDVLIATIDISTDFGATIEEDGKVTLAAGNKGNIIVRIFNGDTNPLKVNVISIDVPTV